MKKHWKKYVKLDNVCASLTSSLDDFKQSHINHVPKTDEYMIKNLEEISLHAKKIQKLCKKFMGKKDTKSNQVDLKPPFPNGSTIKCIKNDAWGIDVDGQINYNVMCSFGASYEIVGCVWSSVCGWLIITPPVMERFGCELHRASDFEIVET